MIGVLVLFRDYLRLFCCGLVARKGDLGGLRFFWLCQYLPICCMRI